MADAGVTDWGEILGLIETFRPGFLELDAARLESIWDRGASSLIYVAQEKAELLHG